MKIPVKKLRSGFSMPVFGLGTWQMGGRGEHNRKNDDAADIAAIQSAINHGITHIDTAESYAAGHAETLLGRAIQPFDRKKLFLVTKVSPGHLRYDHVLRCLYASLERLQTSYVDLYLIHSPNRDIPLKETMKAFEKLVELKKIRHIGVSNFSVERLKEAQSHCRYPIVVNQVHYNLQIREPQRKGLLKYCQEHNVMLVAYRPIEKGVLLEVDAPVVCELCNKYNKSFAQIAINWLISQKNVVTLSKMGNDTHLEENLGAIGWEMEKADTERLRREFPHQVDVSSVCPLS